MSVILAEARPQVTKKPHLRLVKPISEKAADGGQLTIQTAQAILGAVERRRLGGMITNDEQLARAEKTALDMLICGHPENITLATDLHSHLSDDPEDVELFNGYTRLTCCRSFLCNYWQAKRRSRSRQHALRAFDAYILQPGETYLFATCTNTKMPGLTLAAAVKLQNAAFRRLQRRAFYQRHIVGGCRAVEFTVQQFCDMDGDGDGFHVHSHMVLVVSAETARNVRTRDGLAGFELELRSEWTIAFSAECVKQGYQPPSANTDEGYYIGDVRHLYAKTEDGDPLVDGLREAIKYTSKPTISLDMADGQLLELAGAKRPPRMFEIFGCVKAADRVRQDQERRCKAAQAASCLDTENVTVQVHACPELSEEVKQAIWRRRRRQVERVLALAGLPEGVEYDEAAQGWQGFIDDVLADIGREWQRDEIEHGGRDWRLALGEAWRRAWAILEEGEMGVTKEQIERAVRAEFWRHFLEKKPRKSRRERDLYLNRDDYEKRRDFEWRLRQGFARYRLARRFPWAHFRTLDGYEWDGVLRYEIEEQRAAVA